MLNRTTNSPNFMPRLYLRPVSYNIDTSVNIGILGEKQIRTRELCSSSRELSFLGRRLHNLEAIRYHLRDVLVLVLQKPQRKGHIVPLALRVATWQTGRQLVGQLLGVFVL